MTQRCPHCRRDLEPSAFSPSARGRKGFYCIPCNKAAARSHYKTTYKTTGQLRILADSYRPKVTK